MVAGIAERLDSGLVGMGTGASRSEAGELGRLARKSKEKADLGRADWEGRN